MLDLLAMREDFLDGGSRRVCEYSPSAGGHIDTARDRRGDDVSLLSLLQDRIVGVGKCSRTRVEEIAKLAKGKAPEAKVGRPSGWRKR